MRNVQLLLEKYMKEPAFEYQRRALYGRKVGKEGLEPSRLAALDPKSSLSANSSTSPTAQLLCYSLGGIISLGGFIVNNSGSLDFGLRFFAENLRVARQMIG